MGALDVEQIAKLRPAEVELAREYGRCGYRRIAALLRLEGWRVNAKRVQRIWRQEGLKLPGGRHYDRIRPHSPLGYQIPAPEAIEIGPPRPIPQTLTMVFSLA